MPDSSNAFGVQLALSTDLVNVATHIYTPLQTLDAQFFKGSDLATTGTTITLPAVTAGAYFDLTGSLGLTGFSTRTAGQRIICQFDGTPTLTHNGTSFILPGGLSPTVAAGDHWLFLSLGSGNYAGFPMTSPAFTNFTNAQHDHGDTDDGGLLAASAMTDRARAFTLWASAFTLTAGSPVLAVAGGNLNYRAWAMDATSDEVVTTEFVMPTDYAGGDLTISFYHTNLGAGSGDVVWIVGARSVAAAADLNTVGYTSSSITVTAPAQDILKVSTSAVSFAPSATPVLITLRVTRDANDAADTLANDAGLIAVRVQYIADM